MSPYAWALSKTVMVPKKEKPPIRYIRPIALTNAIYKLFMGILKTKVEHQIRQIQQESVVQAGFTKKVMMVAYVPTILGSGSDCFRGSSRETCDSRGETCDTLTQWCFT